MTDIAFVTMDIQNLTMHLTYSRNSYDIVSLIIELLYAHHLNHLKITN